MRGKFVGTMLCCVMLAILVCFGVALLRGAGIGGSGTGSPGPLPPDPSSIARGLGDADGMRSMIIVDGNMGAYCYVRTLDISRDTDTAAYARALAALPEMSFRRQGQEGGYRLGLPSVSLQDDRLVVDYRDAYLGGQLATGEDVLIGGIVQTWFWVPGAERVCLLARGKRMPGYSYDGMPLSLHHTAWHFGYSSTAQACVLTEEAHGIQDIIRRMNEHLPRRENPPYPYHLLPAGMQVDANPAAVHDGVIDVDLPRDFPRTDGVRLAGLVLSFTQFPGISAVHFTFGGEEVDERFMRTRLSLPVTPYDLVLPRPKGEID